MVQRVLGTDEGQSFRIITGKAVAEAAVPAVIGAGRRIAALLAP
jgi:hypothetical protein